MKKQWTPKIEEQYYYVTDGGKIECSQYLINTEDEWRVAQGNCFKTSKEAIQHRTNLQTYTKLKSLAVKLNDGEEMDWENNEQNKYFLLCDYENDSELWQSKKTCNRSQGTIYCLSNHFLIEAARQIGEENLINLMKAGI